MPRTRRDAVLLLSGLPLRRRSSFYHQLVLLAPALEAEGFEAWIGGPELSAVPAGEVGAAGATAREADTPAALARATGARAAILLGYPDQFPLAPRRAGEPPVFLWAQFSRPPRGPWPAGLTAVPLTEATRQHLRQAGLPGIGPVIPHGTDPACFRPPGPRERALERAGLGAEDRFVVGTVAANTPRKRLDAVIEAFAGFRDAAPRPAFLLIRTDREVALDGLDLPAGIARLGLEGSAAVLTGALPLPEMARLYRAMDVYLTLSEWEGFGLPVLEAMASGLPVIRPPIQGPGEIVPYPELLLADRREPDEDGTLLYRPDPGEAARTLGEALRDPALRARLGRLGRREARRRYDIRSVARAWARLIAGSSPPGG